MPRLTRLRLHPVKSCRGYDVDTANLDSLGLEHDRRFQVVDSTGKPFTQRTHPVLAQVDARLQPDALELHHADHGHCSVPLNSASAPRLITTEVWSTTHLQADDAGEQPARFFSDLLGQPARLVRTGQAFHRPVKHHPSHRVGFADAYPLLVISEASLADLNTRLQQRGAPAVPMERFRPNLVLADCPAFAEDDVSALHVGAVTLLPAGPCERCIMTTLDPQTGASHGPEPLRTLATYRRASTGRGVLFGQNLIATPSRGALHVGASVQLIP